MAHEKELVELPANVPAFDVNHAWFNFNNVRVHGVTKVKKEGYKKRLDKMLQYQVFALKPIDWDFLETVKPHNNDYDSRVAEC